MDPIGQFRMLSDSLGYWDPSNQQQDLLLKTLFPSENPLNRIICSLRYIMCNNNFAKHIKEVHGVSRKVIFSIGHKYMIASHVSHHILTISLTCRLKKNPVLSRQKTEKPRWTKTWPPDWSQNDMTSYFMLVTFRCSSNSTLSLQCASL